MFELEVSIRHTDRDLLVRIQEMVSELINIEIPRDEISLFSVVKEEGAE